MSEHIRKNPYMDYRNIVPFMDLSGFVVKQPHVADEIPATSLKEHLMRKKITCSINIRRMIYCKHCEVYRNGRK